MTPKYLHFLNIETIYDNMALMKQCRHRLIKVARLGIYTLCISEIFIRGLTKDPTPTTSTIRYSQNDINVVQNNLKTHNWLIKHSADIE